MGNGDEVVVLQNYIFFKFKTTYSITYFNENEKLTDEQRQVVIEHISFP